MNESLRAQLDPLSPLPLLLRPLLLGDIVPMDLRSVKGARVSTALVRVQAGCPRVETEHRRSRRQYAHANHVPGVVCVAGAFWQLPVEHQRGILLHELGHLALGRRRHTEADADREARRRYGVRVRYRSSARWGKRLEYA